MDMEERYRLIISTILNAIGCQVEVEHMLSTGRIDIVASTSRFIYVVELKLTNNGGLNAARKTNYRQWLSQTILGRWSKGYRISSRIR